MKKVTDHPDDLSQLEDEYWSDERYRQREIREDMGVGYDDIARKDPLKKKVFDLIYSPPVEFSIFALIIVSVVQLVAEVSLPEAGPVSWLGDRTVDDTKVWFDYLEFGLTTVFLVEYVTKLWLAPNKWHFFKANLIDLLAIVPILRVFRIGRAVRLLRLLRMLRMLRLARIALILKRKLSGISDEMQRRSMENLIVFVYLLFSVIFGTVGILVFEKGENEAFTSLSDGLWWCVVTLTTVGYGDKFPVTAGGKVVAALIMFIGLSFYALLTGFLSSVLIERSRRAEENKMDMDSLSGHVVLCNWNDQAERLIADMQASSPDRPIVILTEQEGLPGLLDPNIQWVKADPTTSKGLDAAKVERAAVVVVLADKRGDRSSQDIDARSILTVLAIEQKNSKVHSIVELLNEENVFHVRNAGVDEIIVSESYTGTMLSQAIQNPGVSAVFRDLFDAGTGSQIRQVRLPHSFEGKHFSELMGAALKLKLGIPVGFRRGEEVVVSPLEDPLLRAGDMLLVIDRVTRR